MGNLLQELKRRNVFRVSVAYIVVAWLIIQVIETVSDPLGLPDWTEAFFIVLLLSGLPVIVLFSWAFELTPDGLRKTRDVDTAESVTAVTGKKLNNTIIVVLALALGYFLWERQGLVEQVTQPVQQVAQSAEAEAEEISLASIAVLPFVNMSADPNQEYFSDGISEELLNLLAKIPELRVPARTSSFQFKGQNLDIGDVAKQLNVKHVLEGSVRKADVRVRVTAQLIEADTGYYLWSDTYDRELDDIFAIQDEISAAIVAALSETLGLDTGAVPHVTAAADPEAYNSFLFAQHLINKRTKQDLEAAIPNYERALELDPNYAPAHAGIGLAWYLLTDSDETYGTLSLEESLGNAIPYVERALELDPNLPEALGVMGLTLEARQQTEEALSYYEKALTLNPSLTDVRNWYSSALADLGQRDRALEEIKTAYETDPLSVLTLNNYTNRLMMRRQYDTLDPVLDRLAQVDLARGANLRGWMLIGQSRAADGAKHMLQALDLEPENVELREATAFALNAMDIKEPAEKIWPFPDNLLPLFQWGTDFELVLELAQKRFNDDPTNPDAVLSLAWAQWEIGNTEEGLRLAQRFLDTLGDTRKPSHGMNMMLAFDARSRGDVETAIKIIGPVEARVDQALASGIDGGRIHFGKARLSEMRGDSKLAYQHLEKALMRGPFSVEQVAYEYETMGWNDDAGFVALKEKHREYMTKEREKLIKTACGPDGFESWKPAPSECKRNPGPT